MNVKQILPRLSGDQIAIYSSLFVLFQMVFLGIQTKPTLLSHKNELSALKVFAFATFVAVLVAAAVKVAESLILKT